MAFESPFKADHHDRLTVLRLNSDSSKLLTASIDHRVAVYDIDRPSGKRKHLDTFTAHDAEIRDAKWFHTSTGTHFVTIANDLQMRIWAQDIYTSVPGRHFKRIATIKCEQLVPFVSIDTKTIGQHTYIAVIDRLGLLSLYEPSNPDEYNEWMLVDQLQTYSPTPGRDDHTSFRVEFDPNPFPLPYSTSLSDDEAQLSLAVTTMTDVKLYRSTAEPDIISQHTLSLVAQPHSSSNIGHNASHRLFLFEVIKIPHPEDPHSQASTPSSPSQQLLRDIAYSPSNIRGTDILATACIDGSVIVHEISLKPHPSSSSSSQHKSQPPGSDANTRPQIQTHQSNLTSALRPTAGPQNQDAGSARTAHPFPYTHHSSLISVLREAHDDAWSVQFDPSGQILLSSGNDGVIKMWKRRVRDDGQMGEYQLWAEQAGEEDEEESGSRGDRNGDGDENPDS